MLDRKDKSYQHSYPQLWSRALVSVTSQIQAAEISLLGRVRRSVLFFSGKTERP